MTEPPPDARQQLIAAMRTRTCFCGADSCQTPEPLIDAYAHQLAEKIRQSKCDPGVDICACCEKAADLIDPQAQR